MGTGYATLWSAFKRITGGCSQTEKLTLYSGAATRLYISPEAGRIAEQHYSSREFLDLSLTCYGAPIVRGAGGHRMLIRMVQDLPRNQVERDLAENAARYGAETLVLGGAHRCKWCLDRTVNGLTAAPARCKPNRMTNNPLSPLIKRARERLRKRRAAKQNEPPKTNSRGAPRMLLY
jgi:hypothetical protein